VFQSFEHDEDCSRIGGPANPDAVTPVDANTQQSAWLLNVRDDNLQVEGARGTSAGCKARATRFMRENTSARIALAIVSAAAPSPSA
jgi:hypothetical protein